MTAFYNAAVQNYGHGRNDYDDYYDDYESYDRYDSRDRVRDRDRNRDRERNRDKDFRKRRNQRPFRAQYKVGEAREMFCLWLRARASLICIFTTLYYMFSMLYPSAGGGRGLQLQRQLEGR